MLCVPYAIHANICRTRNKKYKLLKSEVHFIEHFSYCNALRRMRQLLDFDALSILFWTSWSCFMFEINLQLL